MMTLNECTPGKILQTPTGELFKVQSVTGGRIKGTIVFPLQKQTMVREYAVESLNLLSEPKESLLRKFEDAKAKRRK